MSHGLLLVEAIYGQIRLPLSVQHGIGVELPPGFIFYRVEDGGFLTDSHSLSR